MKLVGQDGFDAYYLNIFKDRWNALKQSLLEKSSPVEWKSSKESYFLDIASIRTAITLPLNFAENILDMCAAPGGKTLVLAHLMKDNAFLTSNERSSNRRKRLKIVCDSSLDDSIRQRVKITAFDGAVMCKNPLQKFDAILLDAPCSSERHVIQDKKELLNWTSTRVKTNSITQWALISSAYRMLNQDGFLLYSTCALSREENDYIIERLLKKFEDVKLCNNDDILEYDKSFLEKFCEHSFPPIEKTEYGFRILPDKSNGAGPMFFSLIQKNHS